MSRTYRRRKGEKPSSWITHDFVCVEEFPKKYGWGGKYGLWQDIPRTGKDLKKHLAKYRADGYSHRNHVPSWFVRDFCNKPYRAKMKQEVRNIMKRGDDYLDYDFNPQKNNALWMWW